MNPLPSQISLALPGLPRGSPRPAAAPGGGRACAESERRDRRLRVFSSFGRFTLDSCAPRGCVCECVPRVCPACAPCVPARARRSGDRPQWGRRLALGGSVVAESLRGPRGDKCGFLNLGDTAAGPRARPAPPSGSKHPALRTHVKTQHSGFALFCDDRAWRCALTRGRSVAPSGLWNARLPRVRTGRGAGAGAFPGASPSAL